MTGERSRVLLEPRAVDLGLRRVAGEVVERGPGADNLCIVGVRRGGVPLSQQLARMIEAQGERMPPLGTVDITLYRDDAATALPNPRIGPTEIPFDVEGQRILLVDDVVSTGRTVRAALDAVLDYGRPKSIELAVLIDRGGRELPIQPDYVVRKAEVSPGARVEVVYRDQHGAATEPPLGQPFALVVGADGAA